MLKKIIRNPLFILLCGLILLGLIYFYPSVFSITSSNIETFNSHLNKKEKKATELVSQLKNSTSNTKKIISSSFELFEKEGIALFEINNNKIVDWSERSILLPEEITKRNTSSGVILLKNGWFQYIIEKEKNTSYLALILIKKQYSIKNNYLKNEFHPSFNFNSNFEITLNQGTYPIYNLNKQVIFYLSSVDTPTNTPSKTNWILLLFYLSSIILIAGAINRALLKHTSLNRYNYLFVLGFLLIFRVLNMVYHFPESIFNQEIFSPLIYAHSIVFPSLGDFLIHIVSFFIATFYLVNYKNNIPAKNKLIALFFILIVVAFAILIADLQEGLVLNSNINFDINYILDLSAYSFVGIGTLLLLYISAIILIKAIIFRFSGEALPEKIFFFLFISIALVGIVLSWFFFHINPIHNLWLIIAIFIFSFKNTSSKVEFNKIIFLTIIVVTTISYGFIRFSNDKEVYSKKFIAKKLAKEQDPITEYLFNELKPKIEADTMLQNNLNNYWGNKETIDDYIVKKFFGGFWNNYFINITKCNINDTIYIEDNKKDIYCLDFFNEKIKKESYNTFNLENDIHFLYSDNGISSYLGKMTIKDSSNKAEKSSYLFLELFPKSFSQALGYPELLLDEKEIEKTIHLKNYSFAKYKKGNLVNSSNNLYYQTKLTSNYVIPELFQFNTQEIDGFEHLFYQSDKFSTIIVSAHKKNLVNFITTFSYLFLISSCMFFITSIFIKLPPFSWKFSLTDFNSKIQFFVIASILLSFLLYGWGTTYYIKKQYINKNKKVLSEKIQSIIIELDGKLGEKSKLTTTDMEEMTYYLVKFSNVFYTDINLYDKSGMLLATSRPEVYEVGLISNRMNPLAFQKMHNENKVTHINNEQIGSLNYLSAYVPFYNKNNKFLAYVNLPYFSKQDEFEHELSEFFTALINIYGLLFLISVIIAVFFGNYIAEPLRLIKDKISALSFGKSYETITWTSNDEIGALVKEYNKKVIELEENALKLAKSERESAWREMAKQVAHEIKNPLTPMKLSIQHLQRSSENAENIKEKIDKTATTLIEQIDTLTTIANAFSNFANMPKTNAVKIDVLPIIETTIHLFNETENPTKTTTIKLLTSLQNVFIVADKDQLLSVFTNLIKNALQAIDVVKRDGKIELIVTEKPITYLFEIKDNGEGITDDKKDKIFVPNFTTKNTGMGLGLALVKNIIENMEGKISFTSIPNEGTSFFIEIPKA